MSWSWSWSYWWCPRQRARASWCRRRPSSWRGCPPPTTRTHLITFLFLFLGFNWSSFFLYLVYLLLYFFWYISLFAVLFVCLFVNVLRLLTSTLHSILPGPPLLWALIVARITSFMIPDNSHYLYPNFSHCELLQESWYLTILIIRWSIIYLFMTPHSKVAHSW